MQQKDDPGSVLNYFRKLVALRKKHLALVYGKYTLLDKDNPDVYAYTRSGYGEKLLVVLNFSEKPATVQVGKPTVGSIVLLSNYSQAPSIGKSTVSLRPYEAIIYSIKP